LAGSSFYPSDYKINLH